MSQENMLLKPGDKVFVVERRLFREDLRRHFVGEVEVSTDVGFRATGYPFYYHAAQGNFVRKIKPRTRLFSLHNHLIINLLPQDSDIESANYTTTEQETILTDRKTFRLDVTDPDQKAHP